MANKDNNDKSNIRFNTLKKIASKIQSGNDSLYKNTYYSDPKNKQALRDLKTSIDDSIKNIMSDSVDITGEPNISKLYERIFMNKQNDPTINNEFKAIFEDNEFISQLTNTYLDTKYIKAQDDEVDTILRYMPKLKEAILTLRDNVLSADSFSKDFLSISDELTNTNTSQFSNNIDALKYKYNLLDFINEDYEDTSKYGEQFVYCVPYDQAIEKLLKSRQSIDANAISIKSNIKESSVIEVIDENGIITEVNTKQFDITEFEKEKFPNIDFELDKSGIISSIIEEEYEAKNKLKSVSEQSLTEQYITEFDQYPGAFSNKVTDNDLEIGKRTPVHHKFDNTLSDDLLLPDIQDTTADGLYTKKSSNSDTKIKGMNGCIVRVLPRHKVKPLYINDICLGYYYFEYDDNADVFSDSYKRSSLGMTNTLNSLMSNGRYESLDANQRKEELIRYLASQLSEKIDAAFINSNQDLKKEIYYILKYNEEYGTGINVINNIRVTYIPPQDIHHIYFNLDKETHRGISDIAASIVPATLWCAIYLTNCLGIMTRGNDKRVYYVKQSVETNITKTLLKTINEIKKSNFGIRQIESINNVLNITGRFNDYIIPRGADGNSPIDFEIMQGQDIEIKTDLLNLLEEAAINVTGVPLELIQNRQSPDYAIQLTMSNSKFLRFVYSRQAVYQNKIAGLITKIYNYEYGTNLTIKVTLPPPLFVNLTNTNQLITNCRDYATSLADIVLADNANELVRNIFIREYTLYNLGSYINMNIVKDLVNKAEQLAKKKSLETEEGGEY